MPELFGVYEFVDYYGIQPFNYNYGYYDGDHSFWSVHGLHYVGIARLEVAVVIVCLGGEDLP